MRRWTVLFSLLLTAAVLRPLAVDLAACAMKPAPMSCCAADGTGCCDAEPGFDACTPGIWSAPVPPSPTPSGATPRIAAVYAALPPAAPKPRLAAAVHPDAGPPFQAAPVHIAVCRLLI